MLTNELRPGSWGSMAGQELNKKILQYVVRNPEDSPRSIILSGVFGSGKTTSARILARELNGIKDPNYDLTLSPFYFEYDATIIGNVERVRELRDVFSSGSKEFWKVIVLDEVHAASSQAQTALLKVLEEVEGKTFFLLCTTHIDKVIPTIRSRSLELIFGLVPRDDIVEHLTGIEDRLGISVSDDVKRLIATRSMGHMRNAHMLLNKYMLVGDEVFRESVRSGLDLYSNLFQSILENREDGVLTYLKELKTIPIMYLQKDFSDFIFEIMKEFSGVGTKDSLIKKLVAGYGNNVLKIVKNYYSDWSENIFRSEEDFQSGMLLYYHLLSADAKTAQSTQTSGGKSLKERAMKR